MRFATMKTIVKKAVPLVYVVLTLGLAGSLSLADTPPETQSGTKGSSESLFQQGLGAFQKADYKQARLSFQEALQSGDNPVVLFDLGLTEQRLGNNGLALALWRKALAIKPNFARAEQAIAWTRPKLEHGEISHEVELWESLRAHALATVPLWYYLLSSALLLLVAGWLGLRYFGLRRQARLDERPMPPLPWLAGFCSLGLLVALFLGGAKIYDQSVERGTIVEKKVEARSSPAADATPLFDLYEGLEVIVHGRSENWTQVTYPGGSTGWIPSQALLATNDKAVR